MTSPINKAYDAWGLIYDADKQLPIIYLVDDSGTLWTGKKGQAYQRNSSSVFDQILNNKLFRIRQNVVLGNYNDILITIEPGETEASLFVDGKELKQKKELKHGACEILSRTLGFRLKFEAFADVSDNPELACLGKTYRYISFLGRGGFANVYKGLNVHEEEFRAIKTSRYEDSDPELEREFKFIVKVKHINIVKAMGYVNAKIEEFLITEYIEGGSLEYRINNGRDITESFAKRIFKQLFNAFYFLHLKKILHRDVKPQNIVLSSRNDETCIPKLIDFGLACHTSEMDEMDYIVGSYEYMAPEVLSKKLLFKSEDKYSDKTDIYGLGFTLFIALNRCTPFAYDENLKVYRKKMDEGKANYSHMETYQKLSPGTQHILESCLHVSTKRRPSSMQLVENPWHLRM